MNSESWGTRWGDVSWLVLPLIHFVLWWILQPSIDPGTSVICNLLMVRHIVTCFQILPKIFLSTRAPTAFSWTFGELSNQYLLWILKKMYLSLEIRMLCSFQISSYCKVQSRDNAFDTARCLNELVCKITGNLKMHPFLKFEYAFDFLSRKQCRLCLNLQCSFQKHSRIPSLKCNRFTKGHGTLCFTNHHSVRALQICSSLLNKQKCDLRSLRLPSTGIRCE